MKLSDYQKLFSLIVELQNIGKTINDSDLPFQQKYELTLPVSEALHKLETALMNGRQEAETESKNRYKNGK